MYHIKHVGFIIDGNRRFAKKRNISYEEAYSIGAENVTNLVKWFLIDGRADILSVYALSLDNIKKRTHSELKPIYGIQRKTFEKWKKAKIMEKNNIRVVFKGRKELLPEDYRKACVELENQTMGGYKKFYVLVAYSGTEEIIRAKNHTPKHNLNKEEFLKHLYVKDWVDLIIRTSGEKRLSDFLLYQSAYAEFVSVKKLFPEITKEDIINALEEFRNRKRNFGK